MEKIDHYRPTPEEWDILKELAQGKDLSEFEFWKDMSNPDILYVRTPKHTWSFLCGREWAVNLKTKEMHLTCLS